MFMAFCSREIEVSIGKQHKTRKMLVRYEIRITDLMTVLECQTQFHVTFYVLRKRSSRIYNIFIYF